MLSDWIKNLLESTSLSGFYVLLLTFPLTIVQGVLGLFPYTILIVLNISAMGLTYGLLTSWISSIIVANLVFYCCRSFFSEWFNSKIKRKEGRYEKWQRYFELYGVWTLILLRTLPIIPNNVISLMASVSSIKLYAYFMSSVIGNLSQIWLYGIISSSILIPGRDTKWLIGSYVAFCIVVVVAFFISQFFKKQRGNRITADKQLHL
ncbi:TVP38/TMEM64 family protein [Cohnella lupini]|uniref:TVP38/TMEM64 family membrane protein n=1 Tax=Cohnella lupini TaxID=1294267 RepID=A0A3D9IBS8_9BACL|nr:VTT domain-containing protein [Cohnella lupini]RED59222.1 putative membrane protein YdjX (TVP38/TMEM64 family) [Cohnella lupini]